MDDEERQILEELFLERFGPFHSHMLPHRKSPTYGGAPTLRAKTYQQVEKMKDL